MFNQIQRVAHSGEVIMANNKVNLIRQLKGAITASQHRNNDDIEWFVEFFGNDEEQVWFRALIRYISNNVISA